MRRSSSTSFSLQSSQSCLVFPWLSHHSPHINWSSDLVSKWGPTCQATCLLSRVLPPAPKSLSPLELSRVPSEYHEIWNMCRNPGVSILDRQGGPFSSVVLILCCLIVLALRIRSQMLYPDFFRTLTMRIHRQQSFQIPRLWFLYVGEFRRWYDKPRGGSQILVMVLRDDFMFLPLCAHQFSNGDIPLS